MLIFPDQVEIELCLYGISLNKTNKLPVPMKKTLSISIMTLAAIFIFSSFFQHPEEGKENAKMHQKENQDSISGPVKQNVSFESIWLNNKDFPQLQESPIPFTYSRPGC
jgi:hypothetical protein